MTNPQQHQPPPSYQPVPVHQAQPTNGYAIASLVLSLLWLWGIGSLIAIILGADARRTIKRTGQAGYGLATAGITLGILGLAITLLALVSP
jgi:hypothetical protein